MSSSYPITDVDGITPEIAGELKSIGIRTTRRLLEATKDPKGRKLLAEKTGIEPKRLLVFANAADRMRVPGCGREYAELLRAIGVDTVRELRTRNPAHLAKRMAEANAKRKLVRVLPSERAVGRWIESARKLSLKITY